MPSANSLSTVMNVLPSKVLDFLLEQGDGKQCVSEEVFFFLPKNAVFLTKHIYIKTQYTANCHSGLPLSSQPTSVNIITNTYVTNNT